MLVGMPPSDPCDVAVLRRGDELPDANLVGAGGAAADDAPIAVEFAGEVAALEVGEAAPAEGPRSPEPGSAAATAPPTTTARPSPAAAAATRN
jgi:hypothetical protein